jgi:hypothetical protein
VLLRALGLWLFGCAENTHKIRASNRLKCHDVRDWGFQNFTVGFEPGVGGFILTVSLT